MYGYCKCGYRTTECDQKREVIEQVEQDGGKVAVYMMKDSVCPQCKEKGTLKFKLDPKGEVE